ncbi:MAG: relaxase/mobilization nuclease domain-containing protein, partial [Maricaulaceae bacterium]
MILKASERGGARDLARHLLNDRDNDHVEVHDLRGFIAEDLSGAFLESEAAAKGTRCRNHLFSLSLSPPSDASVRDDVFVKAADRIEQDLRLEGQPRAVVFHEKEGRRHAHVVWSRIDATRMRAINLAHFKTKLNAISRDLFLENGWDLPDGFKRGAERSPLTF